VSGYGENGTGDANDVWRVEIDGGKEGDIVKTVLSRLARQTTPIHVRIQAPF
jgi:dolichyl-phosphate-mannose-protein mannosyltransferase